jgi:predicted DNA-binding transcriptional regulator AlpA
MTLTHNDRERSATEHKRKHYCTARQVCERYGGRSQMWLWRKLKSDQKFPRPLVMGKNLRLFDEDELDAYDATLREATDATVAA